MLGLVPVNSSTSYGYLPQYSLSEVNKPHFPLTHIARQVDAGFRSSSTTLSSFEMLDYTVTIKKSKGLIIKNEDLLEDIHLKSFAKSSVKIKIKISKVEKLGITI